MSRKSKRNKPAQQAPTPPQRTKQAGQSAPPQPSAAQQAAPKKGRAANIERVEKEGVKAVFDAMRPKVFAKTTDPAVIKTLRDLAKQQSVHATQAALAMMRDRPDATEGLGAMSVPTRVVVGTEDGATPPSDAEVMARAIPGATLTRIENAGHFPNVERPEEFNRVLLELVAHVRNERV